MGNRRRDHVVHPLLRAIMHRVWNVPVGFGILSVLLAFLQVFDVIVPH